MNNGLHVSRIILKRLRRFLYSAVVVIGVAAAGIHLLAGGSVLLNADGLVTRCRFAVASPWPNARVRQVFVHPGDWVEMGQEIAIVESTAMRRLLANLAAEEARVSSRIAQLSARRAVVNALLPSASAHAAQTTKFLITLQDAHTRGIVVDRSVQLMTAAKLDAMDKLLTLRGEVASLATEISSNQDALREVSVAYGDSQKAYSNGLLSSPASGYVGSEVALVGEVLVSGRVEVANIYTGASYVVTYIPDNYMFNVEEGQKVLVRGRGHVIAGRVDKVLPITAALPLEFQLPNRTRGRGQLARVVLLDPENFAVDEKVQITSCFLNGCLADVTNIIMAAVPGVARSRRKHEAAPLVPLQEKPPRIGEEITSSCPFPTLATSTLPSTSATR
jgi:multidrug resistance efflux pump